MAATHLIAVPSANDAPRSTTQPESGAHRIRLLQEQARGLAREEVSLLVQDISALAAHAAEMADGGESYPAGVRELTTRIAEELGMHMKVLQAIMDRSAHH